MPDILAPIQVRELIKDVIQTYPLLAGRRIITNRSKDDALSEDDGDAITIWCVAAKPVIEFGGHEVTWSAVYEFEVVSRTQPFGTIDDATMTTFGYIVAAIAPDRTLGGQIQDIQEIDIAPTVQYGTDVSGASLQVRAEFHTMRDDWFTLVTT